MPAVIYQVVDYAADTITPYDSLDRVPDGDRDVFLRMLAGGSTRSRFCSKSHVIIAI